MRQALLVRALEKAKTGRALAKAISKTEQQVSNWKHGSESIPPEAIAEMAVLLGEDPIQALAEEKGGGWTRVAQALKDRISSGFDYLLSRAKPRQSLILAG